MDRPGPWATENQPKNSPPNILSAIVPHNGLGGPLPLILSQSQDAC
jgi:hypothetical protein